MGHRFLVGAILSVGLLVLLINLCNSTITKEVMLGEKTESFRHVDRALEIATRLNDLVVAMGVTGESLDTYSSQSTKLNTQLLSLKTRIQKEVMAIQYGTTCFGLNALDENVCSGRGTCQMTDSCLCNYGSNGVNCENNFVASANYSQTVANYYEGINLLVNTLPLYPEAKNQLTNLMVNLTALNSKLKLFNSYDSNRNLAQSLVYVSSDDIKDYKQDLVTKIASVQAQINKQTTYQNALLASFSLIAKQIQQTLKASSPNSYIPNTECLNFEPIILEPQETSLTWQVSSNVLPVALDGAFTYMNDGYIYLFGGRKSGGLSNSLLRASLNNPTVWQEVGTVGFSKGFGSLVVADGFMYAIGGFDGGSGAGGYTTSVFKAPISSFNVSSSWTTQTSLPFATLATHFIVGDYLYLVGGATTANANRVVKGRLSEQLSTWTDLGAILPGPALNYACIQVLNSVIYLFGAGTNGDKIYTASTRSPTVWKDSGVTLPFTNVNSDFSLSISGQFIYIFGTFQNRAMRAPITDPLNGWKVLTSTMTAVRQASPFLYNNTFYFVAGWTTSSSTQIVSAPVPK